VFTKQANVLASTAREDTQHGERVTDSQARASKVTDRTSEATQVTHATILANLEEQEVTLELVVRESTLEVKSRDSVLRLRKRFEQFASFDAFGSLLEGNTRSAWLRKQSLNCLRRTSASQKVNTEFESLGETFGNNALTREGVDECDLSLSGEYFSHGEHPFVGL
jgi:hypothetical protein